MINEFFTSSLILQFTIISSSIFNDDKLAHGISLSTFNMFYVDFVPPVCLSRLVSMSNRLKKCKKYD